MGRAAARPSTAGGAPKLAAAELGGRLRRAREAQAIGLRELSRRLAVSASMVSQIETGRVMPSVSTLYAIASALRVSLDELVAPVPHAAPTGAAWVHRAGSRTPLQLSSGIRWEILTNSPREDVEFLVCTYEVESESAPAELVHRHGGHEYGIVESGRLGVAVGFETYELDPGDSISFSSSMPHRLCNLLDDRPAVAIWLVTGRSGDHVAK